MTDKEFDIETKNIAFQHYVSSNNTPKDLVDHHIFMSRQTGKTTYMLKNLPNKKLVLVTHTIEYGNLLKKQLKHERPDYDLKNIILVSYKQFKEAEFDKWKVDKLRGIDRSIPVYVDSAVLDLVQLDFIKNVNKEF